MDERINLERMPQNYLMCTHASCTRCRNCLRFLAFVSLPDSEATIRIVNPKSLAQPTDGCSYHRSSEKIRFAKGFIGILDSLPIKVWKSVSYKLQFLYNLRTYYRLRKGEKLLPPKEQERIRDIIRQHGIQNIPDFDDFLEDYAW